MTIMSLSSCRQSIIWRNLINPVYTQQSPMTLSLDISIACIETKPPATGWQWLESGHHSNAANLESSGHRRSDLFSTAQSPALYRQTRIGTTGTLLVKCFSSLLATDLTRTAPLCSLSPGWAAHFGGCFGSGASDQCENIAWGTAVCWPGYCFYL